MLTHPKYTRILDRPQSLKLFTLTVNLFLNMR